MFCLGWSRPDEWLRPILDEFQNELPVDDLEFAAVAVMSHRPAATSLMESAAMAPRSSDQCGYLAGADVLERG